MKCFIIIKCYISYYYAHGMNVNGPAWDGKEEPRLLSSGVVEVLVKYNIIRYIYILNNIDLLGSSNSKKSKIF